MNKKDYDFKKRCIAQCKKIYPTLGPPTKEIIEDQIKRMTKELKKFKKRKS